MGYPHVLLYIFKLTFDQRNGRPGHLINNDANYWKEIGLNFSISDYSLYYAYLTSRRLNLRISATVILRMLSASALFQVHIPAP